MFARAKYLTLTGEIYDGRSEIRKRQQQLDRVVLRMLPAGRPSHASTGANGFIPTDEQVISRALASKSGRRIQALYNGDASGYDSPSEADCALVAALAFYSQDEQQLARILRGSARTRDKLNRDDHVQKTVSKAVEGRSESYDWSGTAHADRAAREGTPGSGKTTLPERSGRHVELTPARSIRSERLRWLWHDRLPLRSLSVIAGEKGLGKSILTNARIVAETTRGTAGGRARGPADRRARVHGRGRLALGRQAAADGTRRRPRPCAPRHCAWTRTASRCSRCRTTCRCLRLRYDRLRGRWTRRRDDRDRPDRRVPRQGDRHAPRRVGATRARAARRDGREARSGRGRRRAPDQGRKLSTDQPRVAGPVRS